MLGLDAISYFLRVVERGSFTAAARQCDVPLSTIGRKIARLESDLGIVLLHRTTRRVSVTKAGQSFYDRCIQAEAMIADAERHIRALHEEPVGILRVLTPHALGLSAIEPTLAEFRRRHPGIKPELTFDDQPLDLIEHGFDIAIRRGPFPDSSYILRKLARASAHLVAAPSYLDRRGRPAQPTDMEGHDTLQYGRAGPGRWRLRHLSGTLADVEIDPVLAANESAALVSQAIGGAGIALLSYEMTRHAIKLGTLEIVLPGWQREEKVDLGILFAPQATLDLKVRLFVDYCVEVFAEWAEAG